VAGLRDLSAFLADDLGERTDAGVSAGVTGVEGAVWEEGGLTTEALRHGGWEGESDYRELGGIDDFGYLGLTTGRQKR
jgi:hypothetical protein